MPDAEVMPGLRPKDVHPQEVRPDPPLGLLLLPKWLTARARTMANCQTRGSHGLGRRDCHLAEIPLDF